MEELEKQVNALCNTFFKEEYGNRLSQFSFGAFRDVLTKTIRDYKVKDGKDKPK